MQRDHRCDHELIGPAACRGKSIVINAPQWTRIIGHLRRGEDDTVLAEQRRQYAEYLRTGSAAMTATWTNSLRAIRERQQNERRAYEESVIRSGEERFEALKAGDEERRQQRIAAAQQLIDRAKEGPRELESAYQHADVLQTREQQCRERAHERGVQQQRRLQAGCETRAAAAQGARELAEMIQVRRRRQDQFKLELAAELAQKRCREQAERAQQMQLERKYRFDEAAAIARKEQMDKEMALAAKQAEKVRRFEEIRAKREKEAKDQQIDAIEQQIVTIQGQARDLSFVRKHHHRATLEARAARRAAIMQQVHAAVPSAAAVERAEEQRLAAVVLEREQRADALEAERKLEQERKRLERRQGQQVELSEACERRRAERQQRQWAVASRFRNEDVSCAYRTQARVLDRHKKRQFAQTMCQQMAERRAAEEAEKRLWTFKPEHDADDAQFFAMAQRLLTEAGKKKKSLYPLWKCVNAYQKRHDLKGGKAEEQAAGGCE